MSEDCKMLGSCHRLDLGEVGTIENYGKANIGERMIYCAQQI